MHEARTKKAAERERERHKDIAITQKALKSMYLLLMFIHVLTPSPETSALPQAMESDTNVRDIIEQAKRELLQKYGSKMSSADARLNELQGSLPLPSSLILLFLSLSMVSF